MNARTARTCGPWAVLLLPVALCGVGELRADVIVRGNIATTTWDQASSPYILVENASVPAGQTLTIGPGTEVVLGPEIRLTVEGQVLAAGEPDARIVFRSPNPDDPDQLWDRIRMHNPNEDSSSFRHCDFINGTIGLDFYLYTVGYEATTLVADCTFRGMSMAGIYGSSTGYRVCRSCSSIYGVYPHLNIRVFRCLFDRSQDGVRIVVQSSRSDACCGCCMFPQYRNYPGYAWPTLSNNIFRNLTGAALALDVAENPGGSSGATFTNNTVVDCGRGVVAVSPFDALIRNNIFVRTGVAVERAGDLSGNVSHNCFFENEQDFVGYPETFGQAFWPNARGIPADLSFNILENPELADGESFRLQPTSPCVDSGCATNDCPAAEWSDVCLPPSLGTTIADIGAYGGPGACPRFPPETGIVRFVRGDANADGKVDVSDAVTILGHLFRGNPESPSCAKALDADDSASVEITDAIYVLGYLFQGGSPPPAPFLACGVDETPDALPCDGYPPCVD